MSIIKEYIALSGPASSQTLGTAVSEALSRGATKILCDKSKSYIIFQRPGEDEEEPQSEGTEVYRFIRQREMMDYPGEFGRTTKEELFNMFLILNDKNLYPAYLLVKDKKTLYNALDMRPSMSLDVLFGAKVIQYGEVEEDTILLAGSNIRNFEPVDITFTVKGVL